MSLPVDPISTPGPVRVFFLCPILTSLFIIVEHSGFKKVSSSFFTLIQLKLVDQFEFTICL